MAEYIGEIMASFGEQQELIWRQIIDMIESEEMFMPWKIKQRASEEAHHIFEKYLAVMLKSEMIVEFKSKNLLNKIAFWMIKRKFKDHENKDEILDLYVKGPKWETYKQLSFQQIGGSLNEDDEIITH